MLLGDRAVLAHVAEGGDLVSASSAMETKSRFSVPGFELLDAAGAVVAKQDSWTWVMPREWRGCIGCHEDREMVAPNLLAEAFVKPAVRLAQPEEVTTP